MTRRALRLLVLFGVAVAVYLVLSLFDRAARADAGSADPVGATDAVTSVKAKAKATATGAGKALPNPKSIIPRSTAPKPAAPRARPQGVQPKSATPQACPQRVHPKSAIPQARAQRIHRTTPEVRRSKVEALKIEEPGIRAGQTVRRLEVRTSKSRQSASDAVRDVARATTTSARMAVVRPKLSTFASLPFLPALGELLDLPQVALGSWTGLHALPQGVHVALPLLPQAQLSSGAQPGLPPAWTPVLTLIPALPSTSELHKALLPQASTQAGPSGMTNPPAAQAHSGTVPFPAPQRQPADRSTPTGQARDSGGGNAPTMGTVSSSWLPEVAAAGRGLATDLIARGRTVRYAGPPS